MSLVAGIDYSTHAVDVVWLDEDTDRAEWTRLPLTGRDAFERTRSVRDMLAPTSLNFREKWYSLTIAFGIEEPRGFNSGALYRVQGAILACLPRAVLVQPWLPSEWRKAVGLPGNAPKIQVAASAHSWRSLRDPSCATGTPPWPQDASDALLIALATRNALQKEDAA